MYLLRTKVGCLAGRWESCKNEKVAIEVVLIGLGFDIPRWILPRGLTQSHSIAKTRAKIKQTFIYIEEIGAYPTRGSPVGYTLFFNKGEVVYILHIYI